MDNGHRGCFGIGTVGGFRKWMNIRESKVQPIFFLHDSPSPGIRHYTWARIRLRPATSFFFRCSKFEHETWWIISRSLEHHRNVIHIRRAWKGEEDRLNIVIQANFLYEKIKETRWFFSRDIPLLYFFSFFTLLIYIQRTVNIISKMRDEKENEFKFCDMRQKW